ncbi:MAG: FkbM family methyltransferase [Candidatus Jorgensenbacteria bacterium]
MVKFKELWLRRLNYDLSRIPVFKYVYRWLRGFLMRQEARMNWKLHDWAMDGLDVIKDIHMHSDVEFRFSKDSCYVKAVDGIEYEFDVWPGTTACTDALRGSEIINRTEFALILKNIRPNSVVVDVGASIGELALNMALNVPGIRIFCFEPNNSTYSILKRNVKRNGLVDKIHCYRIALADRVGNFPITPTYNGGHLILADSGKPLVRTRPTSQEVVETTTLDNFLQGKNLAVSLIKADVEGAELLLLKGAKQCLVSNKPHLLLEIFEEGTNKFGYSPKDIFDYLKDLGYEYVLCTKDKLVARPDKISLDGQLKMAYNFFFYHKTSPFLLP